MVRRHDYQGVGEAEHGERAPEHVELAGRVGVRSVSCVYPERPTCTALVRAAHGPLRLAIGWRLAGQSQHPKTGSWLHPPDLLWGLSRQEIRPKDIPSVYRRPP